MAIVYILTNESMPGTVKIGITDNLQRRIKKDLDNTSTPLPFPMLAMPLKFQMRIQLRNFSMNHLMIRE